jgi:hypothetical protein
VDNDNDQAVVLVENRRVFLVDRDLRLEYVGHRHCQRNLFPPEPGMDSRVATPGNYFQESEEAVVQP